MKIVGDVRYSRLASCVDAAPQFQLSAPEACGIIDAQLGAVKAHWRAVCDEARLGESERNALWGRQFLNPFALQGYGDA
jgi:serine/threonine-protein kinase HipA